jgi:hypothetical protein
MSRGRPAATETVEPPLKYTRVFEDELIIETWTYDLNKFHGPINVDIKYKAGAEKAIKQQIKQAKQEKKTARQMKKINEKNDAKRI